MLETVILTSWGQVQACWNQEGLTGLSLPQRSLENTGCGDKLPEMLFALPEQLEEYFTGRLRRFSLPISLPAGSPFYRAVWEVLRNIPYGEVISYREMAERAGNPGATRAAGTALKHNPLAIILPCHRVIAADGSLGGFAGCRTGETIELKKRLLMLEGHHFDDRGRLI